MVQNLFCFNNNDLDAGFYLLDFKAKLNVKLSQFLILIEIAKDYET
ncbi:MAG: hypothetical protein JWM68_3723 [Verrucomicrobiales bacterium]|nr:hypothetical protein [Verrucomicrobiales bacterium]